MPELHVLPTPQEAARAVAEFVAVLAKERAREQDSFTVALSGGSTPRRFYQVLASPPYAGRLAWDRWHVFWCDERCVPPDHPDSNYRMTKELLLDHVPIPGDRVHRIRGEGEPSQVAGEYQATLRLVHDSDQPAADLVLLGMGEDGHTASLFPGTEALSERHQLVVANWLPELGAHRITFTFPLINAAKNVVFFVTDATKAEMVRRVLETSESNPPPAALVQPESGLVHWFLTQAAAARLHAATTEEGPP